MTNVDPFDSLPRARQVGIRRNLVVLRQRGATAADIASYLRDDENVDPSSVDPSFLKGAFTAFTQGATANMADEAIAGLGATHPLDALRGQGPLFNPNEYASIRDDIRGVDKQFTNDHPLASAGASLAGGLVTGGLLPGGAATTVGKAMLKGAAAGAAYGGVSGVGSGENTADRLTRGGVGAVLGAGTGAALPGGVGLWRSLRNPAAIAQGKMADAIDNSGGIDKLLEQLTRFKNGGRGDIVTPTDLSPQMGSAADFAANVNPGARIALKNIHTARQADVGTRMLGDTQDALGQAGLPPDANAAATTASLGKQARDFAGSQQGYAGIEAANPTFDPEDISKEINLPTVKRAWKAARLAGDLKAGEPIDQLLQTITQSNPGLSPAEAKAAAALVRSSAVNDAARQGVELNADITAPAKRPISFGDMQQLAQELQDRSSAAWANKRGNLGQAYGELADQIKGAIAKVVPNYPQVDQQYGAFKDLQRLTDEGVDWWNKADSRLLDQRVQELSSNPDRLTTFRTGIASELLKQLDNASTNRNVANQIMAASKAMQRKLMTIFGSKDIFDSYMEKASLERQMSQNMGDAVGGSATSRREAGRDAADAAMGLVHGPATALTAGAHLASRAVRSSAQRDAGGIMGNFLSTQGAPDIEALLRGWSDRTPALLSPFAAKATRGLSYGAQAGAGSLFNF